MIVYVGKCVDADGCENLVHGINYYLESGEKYVKVYNDIKHGHLGQYQKNRFEVIDAMIIKEDPLPKDADVLESIEEYEQIALF